MLKKAVWLVHFIISKLAKVFYMLLPKVIRNQYDEAIVYYLHLGRKIFKKKTGVLKVNLIDKPESFDSAIILQVERNRSSKLSAPVLLKNSGQEKILKPIEGDEPDVYILKISKCLAIGWTIGILKKQDFFHPELAQHTLAHDNKREYIYTYNMVGLGVEDVKVTYQSATKTVDLAIHLLKEHSPNYFHWLYETMPRLIYTVEYLKKSGLIDAQYTILLDKGLPSQCVEMLRFYMKRFDITYKLLFVKPGEFIHCKNLYYVSPFWYALDNTKSYPNIHKDFLVDRHAVELVRDTLLLNLKPGKPSRKIYLARRSGQMRNMTNINEVEAMFDSLDFEIVYTDIMSFAQQRELFDEAKIVVGAAGAAFSNIVFMQKGSIALMFSPSIIKTNYYIFQQLADVAGVELLHFLTLAKKDAKSVHEDFTLDCNELKRIIKDRLGGN